MSGYNRQSTYTELDTTLADDTNNEFTVLETAMSVAGHNHAGAVDEGSPVPKISNDTLDVVIETEGTQGIYFEDELKFNGDTADLGVVSPLLKNHNLEALENVPDGLITDAQLVSDLHLVSQEFTSAEKSKLAGIQSGASRDQTKASLRRLLLSNDNMNVLSDKMLSQLDKLQPKTQTFSFSKEIKFIDPTVSSIQVRVIRTGSTRRSKVIHVETVADTAVSPTHYTDVDTDITFAQGVSYVDVPVTVVPGAYSTGLVFGMKLTDVDVDTSTVVSDVTIELVIQPTAEGGTGTPGPKGDTGEPGDDGAPGEDGQTSYVHTAYATNADGTEGFSLTDTVGKEYLGVYSDFNVDPSVDPTLYTWQLVKGEDGEDGEEGAAGIRGSRLLYADGTAWSDSIANDILNSNFGNKVEWDAVTISDDTTGFSQTRYWDGASWVIIEQVIDGNLLVTESIRGTHISSGTTIIAGSGNAQAGMNGFDSGIYSGWRFWAGHATPASAPFRVNYLGQVTMTSASIQGSLDGSTLGGSTLTEGNILNSNTQWIDIAGTTNAPENNATANQSDTTTNNAISTAQTNAISTSGTNANNAAKTAGSVGGWNLSSSYIYVGGTTTSGNFAANGNFFLRNTGEIRSPKFAIHSNGNAFFKGDISGATGTFSGNLSAAGGTFSGNLSSAGGTFSGNLSAAGGTFSGNLSAAGGTFSGDISGAKGTFTRGLNAQFNGAALKIGYDGSSIQEATMSFNVSASKYGQVTCDSTGVRIVSSGGAINSVTGYTSIGGSLNVTGTLTIPTITATGLIKGGTITQTSDSRTKFDIQPITNASEKRMSLQGYTYDTYEKNSSRSASIIAQEVRKVLPEAIYENDESEHGGYKDQLSVNPMALVGLLVQSANEDRKLIDSLVTRIEKLEKELSNDLTD